MRSVLILDIEQRFGEEALRILRAAFDVQLFHRFDEARDFIAKRSPELILLGTPVEDPGGYFAFAQETHSLHPEIRIVLTAKAPSKEFLVRAISGHFHGFIEQPFTEEDLRHKIQQTLSPWKDEEMQVDFYRRAVRWGNQKVQLTRTEFSLLLLLRRNAGVFLSRKEIEAEIWPQSKVAPNNLDTHLSRLRSKVPLLRARLMCLRGEGFIYTPDGVIPESVTPLLQRRK